VILPSGVLNGTFRLGRDLHPAGGFGERLLRIDSSRGMRVAMMVIVPGMVMVLMMLLTMTMQG